MSGWTPGPWMPHATGLARSGKPEHEIHWSEDGECIAEIVHGKPEAHLIAAAPDLYKALQSMLTFYGMDREKGEVSDVIHAEAEKALAKARGEGDES